MKVAKEIIWTYVKGVPSKQSNPGNYNVAISFACFVSKILWPWLMIAPYAFKIFPPSLLQPNIKPTLMSLYTLAIDLKQLKKQSAVKDGQYSFH